MSYDDKPWLKSYDEGIAPEVLIPDISLADRFDEVLEFFPQRPAVHFFGLTVTYEILMGHANRFAWMLIETGSKPGDVVAINLPNLPQYLIAQIGALKAGCSTSGLSPLLTPNEMAFQLNDCKARVLVTLDAVFEHRLLGIIDNLPHLKLVIATGILEFLPKSKQFLAKVFKKVPTGKLSPVPGKNIIRFTEMLARYPDDPPVVKIDPEYNCLVQYTGGTTGLPKGTLLTHRNMIANMLQVYEWIEPEMGKEIGLSGFAFFHLAGLMLGLLAVTAGGAQVLIPDPRDTKHIIREMNRCRPTILINVPSLYMMLLDEPGFRKLDFSDLKFCISGAAPFPADIIRKLEEVIGRNKVIEVYGMTETSPIVTMNPRKGEKRVGTVGLPVQSTKVKLVDIETGLTEVPVGEEGELIVQGPQVMKGYLNRPEENNFAVRENDSGRWLHTGDVARMDEDGYFTIVDRTKDMVIVGGFKVFSREVEEKLHEHPAIDLCAVIGVPNPERPGSELVKLFVKISNAHQARKEEDIKADIFAFARENLSPYKVPKIIRFMEEMPLTVVGKVDKKALRRERQKGGIK